MKRLLIALLAFAQAANVASAAEPPERPAFVEKQITPKLVKELRRGGFVLYMRHGYTDNSRADRVPSVDLADCNTQRQLSDKGRALMRDIGTSLRAARIPLGKVLVSPMCRTRESAQLAFGNKFEVVEPLMYSANMTSDEKKPRVEALRQLLVTPPARGTNTLILAHAPNLDDLIGFFVKPEGTVVVFRKNGDGFDYLASIHPDDWNRLRN